MSSWAPQETLTLLTLPYDCHQIHREQKGEPLNHLKHFLISLLIIFDILCFETGGRPSGCATFSVGLQSATEIGIGRAALGKTESLCKTSSFWWVKTSRFPAFFLRPQDLLPFQGLSAPKAFWYFYEIAVVQKSVFSVKELCPCRIVLAVKLKCTCEDCSFFGWTRSLCANPVAVGSKALDPLRRCRMHGWLLDCSSQPRQEWGAAS